MKKLNKLGIAIICSLTPAVALGVTAGVVVGSMKSGDQQKVVTKKEWFDALESIIKTMSSPSNTLEYTSDQISYSSNVNLLQ